MTYFVLTSYAKKDYKGILRFTRTKFGPLQRDRYKLILDQAIYDVALEPNRPGSRPRDEIYPGVRTFHISKIGKRASHFLVYRVLEKDKVEITRILHDGMELDHHMRHL